ncbi:MAG: malate dehydrogenase [Dehalococcoidales bacterium]|nr:malate dehydrogenase [Dehalococcoidales bacterium]
MKISIIGAAGYVGSNITSVLALNGLGDEIVVVDPPKANIVTHLAMDVGTAAFENDITVRAGEYDAIEGSGIVIIAAGAAHGVMLSRMDVLPKNLPIIRDIAAALKRYCPGAVVLTATNPVDPLNYAIYRLTGFDRRQIIGYSTNDSIRFQMMVAEALGCKTRDVEGVVLGEHGESEVLLFSSVRIKGKYVEIDAATRDKIRARIPEILRHYEELKTGRTTGVTSAAGAKKVVNAIINNTGEVFSCSAVLDGEYGQRNISMGVPAALGKGGIKEIKELKLSSDEQSDLNKSIAILKNAMRQVDDFIGAV